MEKTLKFLFLGEKVNKIHTTNTNDLIVFQTKWFFLLVAC